MIQVTLGGVKAQEQTEKPFPKYMISTHDGAIVYFFSQSTGVQINEAGGKLPHYSDFWNMSKFEDYDPSTAVNQPSKKEIHFPKLMISIDKEIIILATEANVNSITGTCIYSIKKYIPVGESGKKWRADIFSDLTEPITLTFENK